MTQNKAVEKRLNELDELASKFIIGHKRMSIRQRDILKRIDKLNFEYNVLVDRCKRLKNMINIMYGKL